MFGDFRYKSYSLGKVVSSPFSIHVKVVNGTRHTSSSKRTPTPQLQVSASMAPRTAAEAGCRAGHSLRRGLCRQSSATGKGSATGWALKQNSQ